MIPRKGLNNREREKKDIRIEEGRTSKERTSEKLT